MKSRCILQFSHFARYCGVTAVIIMVYLQGILEAEENNTVVVWGIKMAQHSKSISEDCFFGIFSIQLQSKLSLWPLSWTTSSSWLSFWNLIWTVTYTFVMKSSHKQPLLFTSNQGHFWDYPTGLFLRFLALVNVQSESFTYKSTL